MITPRYFFINCMLAVSLVSCIGCFGQSKAVKKVIQQRSINDDKELTSHAEVVRIHQEAVSAQVNKLRKECEALEAIHDSQSAIDAGRNWGDEGIGAKDDTDNAKEKKHLLVEMDDIEYERLSANLRKVNESAKEEAEGISERTKDAFKRIEKNESISRLAKQRLRSGILSSTRIFERLNDLLKEQVLLVRRYPPELRATIVMNQINGCEALGPYMKRKTSANIMGPSSTDSFYAVELSPIADLDYLADMIDVGTIRRVNVLHRIIEIRLSEDDTVALASIRKENQEKLIAEQRLARQKTLDDRRERDAESAEVYRLNAIASQEEVENSLSNLHEHFQRIDSIPSFNDLTRLINNEVRTLKRAKDRLDREKDQYRRLVHEDLDVATNESDWVQKIDTEISRLKEDYKLRALLASQFGKDSNAKRLLNDDAPSGGYSNPSEDRNHPDFFAANLVDLLVNRSFGRRKALDRLVYISPSEVTDIKLRKELTRAIRDVAMRSSSSEQLIAARCLSNWAGQHSVLFLSEMLRKTHSDEIKKGIIALLAKYPSDESARAVCQCVGDRRVNEIACSTLISMGSVAEDAVLKTTAVSDPLQCWAGIKVLEEIGTEKSLALLRKALESSNRDIIVAAKEAARKISRRSENEL